MVLAQDSRILLFNRKFLQALHVLTAIRMLNVVESCYFKTLKFCDMIKRQKSGGCDM
jgi:hypothetical protein